MVGIGIGIGIAFGGSASRPRTPSGITPELVQRHVEAVAEFQRDAALTDVGRIIEPDSTDLLSERALAQLYPPGANNERIVQAGSIPLELINLIRREPRNLCRIHPRKFEEVVAEMLARMGWSTVLLTPTRGDGGKDIIASRRLEGGIPITFYFECKRYQQDDTLDLETVRAFAGVLLMKSSQAHKGILVTTARFSSGAHEIFSQEHRIEGRDYPGLLDWMNEIDWT
jgi:hypothetical protein